MAVIKYSKQREAIKTFLASTKEHPTADQVYMHVREEFPNISLGTVYRNLNLLAELGEVVKITTPDGADRFDGCTRPHYHVLCVKCGRLTNLETAELMPFNEMAGKHFSGKIHSHDAMFFGVCEKCLHGNVEKEK